MTDTPPGARRDAWTLRAGGEEVAKLVVTDGDFPWLNARVEAGPGFEPLREIFETDLEALNAPDIDVGAMNHAYDRIREAVTLHYPDGNRVPEFLLHIDGDAAWWRWSDEPFDD